MNVFGLVDALKMLVIICNHFRALKSTGNLIFPVFFSLINHKHTDAISCATDIRNETCKVFHLTYWLDYWHLPSLPSLALATLGVHSELLLSSWLHNKNGAEQRWAMGTGGSLGDTGWEKGGRGGQVRGSGGCLLADFVAPLIEKRASSTYQRIQINSLHLQQWDRTITLCVCVCPWQGEYTDWPANHATSAAKYCKSGLCWLIALNVFWHLEFIFLQLTFPTLSSRLVLPHAASLPLWERTVSAESLLKIRCGFMTNFNGYVLREMGKNTRWGNWWSWPLTQHLVHWICGGFLEGVSFLFKAKTSKILFLALQLLRLSIATKSCCYYYWQKYLISLWNVGWRAKSFVFKAKNSVLILGFKIHPWTELKWHGVMQGDLVLSLWVWYQISKEKF